MSSTGFCVYLIPETLRVTNMGAKREGDSVNLEMEAQTQVRQPTAAKQALRLAAEHLSCVLCAGHRRHD